MFVFFVFLFSILCIPYFYFVLLIVSPFGAVPFLFLHKYTNDSNRVENPLQ